MNVIGSRCSFAAGHVLDYKAFVLEKISLVNTFLEVGFVVYFITDIVGLLLDVVLPFPWLIRVSVSLLSYNVCKLKFLIILDLTHCWHNFIFF